MKYGRGFVVGKFLPCHTGHHYLISTAQAQCEQLTVAVVRDETFDTIAAEHRMGWIQSVHPDVDVLIIDQLQGMDDNSRAWADYTIEVLGRAPDVVFTSEAYGVTWAQELGCAHVQVDLDRTTFPVSGTQVRNDPYGAWDYCCPPSKAYFTKRICLIGGESVGKTTLAGVLADYYDTVWCGEYGRYYVEMHGANPDDPDIWDEIYSNQPIWENAAAEAANKLLIVDTDLITTSVWYERWVGNREGLWMDLRSFGISWANQYYDLYLYLDHDVPWIQDGSRSEGDPEVRNWFGIELLKGAMDTKVPLVMVNGSYDDRFKQAVKAIDGVLPWIAGK